MNGGLILGILFIIGGIVILAVGTGLVIRGTGISYGWFLIVFGIIRLIGSARQN
jgi:hypothetical protein